MAETFCMRIGEYDRPDVQDFLIALHNFLGLLRDIDASIAQKKTGNLLWRVTDLRKDPIPIIGVTPFVFKKHQDSSQSVQREVFGNLAMLNEKGEWSQSLPYAALVRVEKIAKTTPNIGSSVIYIDSRQAVETPAPTATITRQTMEQLEILRDPKSAAYGTIYGELGSICIRKGNEYRVWDEDSGRPVVCAFNTSEEEDVKNLLRKRVAVTGMVQFNSHGWPISVQQIESRQRVEDEDLPTIAEMVGLVPNFTGGVSLEDFLEE